MTDTQIQTEPEILHLDLGERSYDIVVGNGLLERAGEIMKPVLSQPRVIIVTDENVAGLYLPEVAASLDDAGIDHDSIVLPAGEGTKDFSHLQWLTDKLLAKKVERNTALIALGGGVIGDITGFAAAIVLRGIPFIQIPTTLLAQVDSSVGGKTGINAAAGKNLIGAFYQPQIVIADTGALDTLPRRELLAGYAEVVKYGLISDAEFFAGLETNATALIDGDDAARRNAVMTSCAAKATIVAEDERETGRRALLNLGHTFGHALEAQTGYGEALLHGESVAIGTMMAFDLSVRLGLCPTEDAERVRRHFIDIGLPVQCADLADDNWSAEVLMDHMSLDKKVSDGRLTFVLVRGIGDAFTTHDVDPDAVAEILRASISAT